MTKAFAVGSRSVVTALFLAELFRPWLQAPTLQATRFGYTNPIIWGGLLDTIAITTGLSGTYPVFLKEAGISGYTSYKFPLICGRFGQSGLFH